MRDVLLTSLLLTKPEVKVQGGDKLATGARWVQSALGLAEEPVVLIAYGSGWTLAVLMVGCVRLRSELVARLDLPKSLLRSEDLPVEPLVRSEVLPLVTREGEPLVRSEDLPVEPLVRSEDLPVEPLVRDFGLENDVLWSDGCSFSPFNLRELTSLAERPESFSLD